MTPAISSKDLNSYYKIDRDIFSRMVTVFMRDPAESLLVIALWLWLEQEGYPNIISKMIDWPRFILEILINEVVSALKFLETNHPLVTPHDGGMNFTSQVMERDISLQFFHEKRLDAIDGIKKVLNSVCAKIFTDTLVNHLKVTPIMVNQRIQVPGFPHELFGDIEIVWRGFTNYSVRAEVLPWDFPSPENNISDEENDKTLYLTFSRGHSVNETDLREIFSRLCGHDCVANVHIQENVSSIAQQPQFARLVFNFSTNIDRIINGRNIAKFNFGGRHFWGRKYVRNHSD
ncbi:hypothetical protein Dsin_016936 [Dipteronia sinensis]|uniref:RRM domain-containing protein n=1 Tax=Dipteronia sinensis TaxID=43782 RepID=A0AAE0AFH0_9ROSI|nr:hypothetical protein Dsin_016936 [Dipteronia sinensis]